MRGVETADAVDVQGRLAALLAEQCAWRGIDASSAALLDALGMAGLVLAEHGDECALNPATVAAILEAIDDPAEGPLAEVVSLEAYRVASVRRPR